MVTQLGKCFCRIIYYRGQKKGGMIIITNPPQNKLTHYIIPQKDGAEKEKIQQMSKSIQ